MSVNDSTLIKMAVHNSIYYINKVLSISQLLETDYGIASGFICESKQSEKKENQQYDDLVIVAGTEGMKKRLFEDYKNKGLDEVLDNDRSKCKNGSNYLGSDNYEAGNASLRAMRECWPSKTDILTNLNLAGLCKLSNKQILVHHWANGGTKKRIVAGDPDFLHELWPSEYIDWSTVTLNLRDSANGKAWKILKEKNKDLIEVTNMSTFLRIFITRIFEQKNCLLTETHDDDSVDEVVEAVSENDEAEATSDDLNKSNSKIEENMNDHEESDYDTDQSVEAQVGNILQSSSKSS